MNPDQAPPPSDQVEDNVQIKPHSLLLKSKSFDQNNDLSTENESSSTISRYNLAPNTHYRSAAPQSVVCLGKNEELRESYSTLTTVSNLTLSRLNCRSSSISNASTQQNDNVNDGIDGLVENSDIDSDFVSTDEDKRKNNREPSQKGKKKRSNDSHSSHDSHRDKKQKTNHVRNPYRKEWADEEWCFWDEFDETRVRCKVCGEWIKFAAGGRFALLTHAQTSKHKNNLHEYKKPTKQDAISLKSQVSTAEGAITRTMTRHCMTYAGVSALMETLKIVVPDSEIIKNIKLGRTKAAAITVKVLAPMSKEHHLNYIRENETPCTVQTDSTTLYGTCKLFAVSLHYNHRELGQQFVLLDIIYQTSERAVDVALMLLDVLEKNDIPPNLIRAFSGDNVNINFGEYNSVSVHLSHFLIYQVNISSRFKVIFQFCLIIV